MIGLWIALGAIGVIIVWLIATFNGLITLRNRTDEAWSDIDVQLKRRYDLIPNLVETVKGYAGHEKEVFEKVTLARAAAINAEKSGNPAEIAKTENMLAGTLKSLFAVAESYPDLKANKDFLKFQEELSSTENRIAGARKYYNGAVMYYDNARQGFPGNIVARLFTGKFPGRDYFEIQDPTDRKAPPVSTA